MICEDHTMLAGGLAEALAGDLEVVAITHDPDEVADLVGQLRPGLCLMGARYSGVERLDVLAHVGRANPGTRVVLLASAATPEVWRAFDTGQVAAVVGKGSTLATTRSALERVRRGERFVLGFHRRRAAAPAPGPVVSLTARELDVLAEIVAGATTKEMARSLGISVNTVRTHAQHVLDKLGVGNRVQAARVAVEQGLLEPAEGDQR